MVRAKNRVLVSLQVLVVLCCGVRSSATEFGSPSRYAVGSSPNMMAIGDFNGDGKPDLAVVSTTSNNVSILLGNGDGTFQAAKNSDVGASVGAMALGDFNGDGKLDVAVFAAGNSSSATAGQIRILVGNGDGTFQSPVVTTLTPAAASFAVGDFNGDKKDDIVVGNTTSTASTFEIDIALGNGDGTFQAAKVAASGLRSSRVAAADFNRDGKLDLAANGENGIFVLAGQGNGTFIAGATSTPLTLGTASQYWIADLNNDGNPDLIVSSTLFGCSSGVFHICSTRQNIGVLLGDGKGSFGTEQRFATGNTFFGSGLVLSMGVGDVNGDGMVDVVYRQRMNGGFPLVSRLGKGDGTFSTPILLPDPGVPISAAADFNGDKLADLVALDSGNSSAAVFANESPASGTDLGIISSGASPEPVGVGQNLTYTTDVMNEGPKDATGVTLTDTLPANVTFVSATASQGSCSATSSMVTCTIGALGDTDDVQVTIVVTPTTTGSITNTMKVSGNETDGASDNNSAMQTSTVLPVYTLTVTKSGNGSGTITSDAGLGGGINCGSTCTNTYLSGASAILNQNMDPGSLLQSWGGACAGSDHNSGCNVVMDSNKTVTANIVLGITLNVSVTGGGQGTVSSADGSISCSDTGGACSSLNLPGTQASLTATPSGNSQFDSWSGGCTGTNPNSCSVTLNSNQTVTAKMLPASDFQVTAGATTLALAAGSKVSEVLSFAAQGNFAGAIALSCSVSGTAPGRMPTCGISPTSVNPGSNATLTVDAAGVTLTAFRPRPFQMPTTYVLCLGLAALAFLAATTGQQRRRAWLLAATVLVVSIFPAACGSGSSGPPQPKNFTVTVTATAGAIQHTTTIRVTVD